MTHYCKNEDLARETPCQGCVCGKSSESELSDLLSESEGLTVSRLLRFAATQICIDQRQWDDARQALAECPDTEDTAIAWNELEQKQTNCGCTSCTARRMLKDK